MSRAGRELAPIVEGFGAWGPRWLPRHLADDELDPTPLLWDMRRRGRASAREAQARRGAAASGSHARR